MWLVFSLGSQPYYYCEPCWFASTLVCARVIIIPVLFNFFISTHTYFVAVSYTAHVCTVRWHQNYYYLFAFGSLHHHQQVMDTYTRYARVAATVF